MAKEIVADAANDKNKIDEPRITMIYLGVDVGKNNKTLHKWYDLTGINNDGKTLGRTRLSTVSHLIGEVDDDTIRKRTAYYGAGNIAKASIGQIWCFIKTEKGVRTGGSYIGLWKNADDIKEWMSDDVATKAELQEARRPTREKTSFVTALDSLAPICRAYKRATTAGRAALLQKVISHVIRGK